MSPGKAGKVVVFGSLSQDLHLDMQRHPHSGETVMSGDITYRFGGKGANQAIAAARAGAPSVFIGKVGDDPHGHQYIDRLGRFGVDTSEMEVVQGAPTGTAIIYVDATGENMIVVAPGANFRNGLDDLARLDAYGAGDVLLMPLELPLDVVAEAARKAAARGMRVVVNLAPYAPMPADVLQLCDPVIANEHEAQLLHESGATIPSLLVTLGADGSRWGDIEVPAIAREAVDTTGAGDAYCGTFAARLAMGDGREQAMTAASRAASECIAHHGAQPDLPTG
jgi:ribokinase